MRLVIDIDNNTWAGFDALRKSVAMVDIAQMQYTQQLSIFVWFSRLQWLVRGSWNLTVRLCLS